MREFVGVRDYIDIIVASYHDSGGFKRWLLVFDRIAVPLLGLQLKAIRKRGRKEWPVYVHEMDWLLGQGMVFEPDAEFPNEQLMYDEEYKEYFGRASELTVLLEETTKGLSKRSKQYERQMFAEGVLANQWHARMVGIQLRKLNDVDAYPVFFLPFEPVTAERKKQEVVKIALRALPTPDESTPWEQIIEYRSDPDSQSKFLPLRHWMSEVARAELTPAEVEEKLEYLTDQYQQHMKLHQMKTNASTLETIVTTGAEMLGDLFSFKWGKAAQALFSLKRRNVALLEGELTAPGNEVAYVVKARETFS